jgi:hypothetical protein
MDGIPTAFGIWSVRICVDAECTVVTLGSTTTFRLATMRQLRTTYQYQEKGILRAMLQGIRPCFIVIILMQRRLSLFHVSSASAFLPYKWSISECDYSTSWPTDICCSYPPFHPQPGNSFVHYVFQHIMFTYALRLPIQHSLPSSIFHLPSSIFHLVRPAKLSACYCDAP